jgi:hypothetical protein
MAEEPAQSLAEGSVAAASGNGVAGLSRRFVPPGFAERNLRRCAGSYAACVDPNPAIPAIASSSAGPVLRAEWR